MARDDEPQETPLGRAVEVPREYDPTVLVGIGRPEQREALGLRPGMPLPFRGLDTWNAWEFSWLDSGRVPHAAVLTVEVPAASAAIVESKSLKLYLAGFAGTPFADADEVLRRLGADLAAVIGTEVRLGLRGLGDAKALAIQLPQGGSLDSLGVAVPGGPPDPGVLVAEPSGSVDEKVFTDLFQSRCPVTGQPDHATVLIRYRGPRIDRASLQAYLLSYRDYRGFHEQCAERIFLDVVRAGRCEALQVDCRFTRRGGIDINPVRSMDDVGQSNPRMPRQ